MQLTFLRPAVPSSHLLARLGMADKIGNLVGQFDFSGNSTCIYVVLHRNPDALISQMNN